VWKIGDFGTTTEGTSKRLIPTPQQRGTRAYMPPEILRDPERAMFNNKTDIWALGCIMWEMMFGEKLFNGVSAIGFALSNDDLQLPDIIETGKVHIDSILIEISALLAAMLQRIGSKRPDASLVLELFHKEMGSCRKEMN
jgi:serine/threonine protein kinase